MLDRGGLQTMCAPRPPPLAPPAARGGAARRCLRKTMGEVLWDRLPALWMRRGGELLFCCAATRPRRFRRLACVGNAPTHACPLANRAKPRTPPPLQLVRALPAHGIAVCGGAPRPHVCCDHPRRGEQGTAGASEAAPHACRGNSVCRQQLSNPCTWLPARVAVGINSATAWPCCAPHARVQVVASRDRLYPLLEGERAHWPRHDRTATPPVYCRPLPWNDRLRGHCCYLYLVLMPVPAASCLLSRAVPAAADILLLHGLGVKLVIVCGAHAQVWPRSWCGVVPSALIRRGSRRQQQRRRVGWGGLEMPRCLAAAVCPLPALEIAPSADQRIPAGSGTGAAAGRRIPCDRCRAVWRGYLPSLPCRPSSPCQRPAASIASGQTNRCARPSLPHASRYLQMRWRCKEPLRRRAPPPPSCLRSCQR